ncbi:hypothetical protein CFOL_v3_04628 [Cephalotus follicularis]|uniref:RVT_1 domain-containing protein n=1 Tax=Cephalotus follicularis TaxID=3775 RepID=A0A1Q3AZF4_CEPFO|nr:hypothetical protein CFOL_v3_04628 [Cephalotus follicularis]
MVKVRQSKNHIVRIREETRNWVEREDDIAQVAVNYFSKIMGSFDHEACTYNLNGYDKRITGEQVRSLGSPISRQEVKDALWSQNPSKAPGPDGYTGSFYRAAWSLVGEDCIDAILDFFATGYMPQCLNATILALIPKLKIRRQWETFNQSLVATTSTRPLLKS